MRPSSPAAPRTALPSTATVGSGHGPASGNVTGPGCARAARYAPACRARACAPSADSTRTTVSGCGATRIPSAFRLAPAAASASRGAACTQAVTSSIVVHPDSTAAVHSTSTQARECRIPRRSRGSGTAAKHSARHPPDAARSAAAREASSPRASSARAAAAASTGMRDLAGNGASGRDGDLGNPLS